MAGSIVDSDLGRPCGFGGSLDGNLEVGGVAAPVEGSALVGDVGGRQHGGFGAGSTTTEENNVANS
jgi:hypothetical protein